MSSPPAEHILEAITHTLVERFAPRRIILFGSRARGGDDDESDFDLFVEMDSDESPPRRASAVSLALAPRDYALDVVVYTPAEVERLRRRVGSLVHIVETEGRVLYERTGP